MRAGSGGTCAPRRSEPREVVVLLTGVDRRPRLAGALARAGHRVTVLRSTPTWLPPRRPPVLVTDDGAEGRRVRAEAAAAMPGTSCVVLVGDPDPRRYRELLAGGATALPSGAPDDDVVVAVAAAARSLTCVPAEAARSLAGAAGDEPAVTAREVSWLRVLADGGTVAGLARTVGYSEREMYRLLRGLYARLGADTRTEALLRADRRGLLVLPTRS